MGAVKAWLEAIVGLWIIATAIVFTQPLFTVIDSFAQAVNATNNPTYQFVMQSMQYVLIPIGLSILIHAFSSATKTEEESYIFR